MSIIDERLGYTKYFIFRAEGEGGANVRKAEEEGEGDKV